MVMVRPPPGVFSGSSVRRIASVMPRASVSPTPTRAMPRVALSRSKGANIRSRAASPGRQATDEHSR
jgi:hypothetical protein